MKSYGQHCPVAQAAEILNQRWTILIVRDILYGARRFNEIRRFLPLVSPSLLSERLRYLERTGIIERHKDQCSGFIEYIPTQSAKELLPVVELLGAWGQRWIRNRFNDDDLDVSFLMHGIEYVFEPERLPFDPCVIEFHFLDIPPLMHENWKMDYWWLVIENREKELCLHDPNRDVDLLIETDLRSLTRFFLGDFTAKEAIQRQLIQLHGEHRLIKEFDSWMPQSHFSRVPKPPAPLDLNELVRQSPAAALLGDTISARSSAKFAKR